MLVIKMNNSMCTFRFTIILYYYKNHNKFQIIILIIIIIKNSIQ